MQYVFERRPKRLTEKQFINLEWKKGHAYYTKTKTRNIDRELRRDFGKDLQWYQKKFEEQGGKCAICRRPAEEFKKRLAVDHDHVTDECRGLLCGRCNTSLERLEYVPNFIENALAYLEKYKIAVQIPIFEESVCQKSSLC